MSHTLFADILIKTDDWQRFDGLEDRVQICFDSLTKYNPKGFKPGIATILLSDDREVKALNKKWRHKDKPTNILSFPTDFPPLPGDGVVPLLGDMVLAYETCAREADQSSTPFMDHFSHLILHGALHLMGYDHEEAAAAEEMETIEIACLAAMGVSNPYE